MNNFAPLALEARNLSVSAGGGQILRNCSFHVGAGEFIAVVGPNGAGKSTLARALAGLLTYTGFVGVGGLDLLRMRPAMRARQIAYLPQQTVAHWPMSVHDVVRLGRMPFSSSLQRLTVRDEEIIHDALNSCGLMEYAGRLVTGLSGGELARVLLARVFAVDAPILIVDEPTAALDPAHQLRVMDLLARQAASGKVVIAVSHDISFALRHTNRMIVLESGRIAGDGSPSEMVDSEILARIFGVRFLRAMAGGESGLLIAPRNG